MENMTLESYITLSTKFNYRWSADINANSKIINLSEENIEMHIHDRSRHRFLNKTHEEKK